MGALVDMRVVQQSVIESRSLLGIKNLLFRNSQAHLSSSLSLYEAMRLTVATGRNYDKT